MVGISRVIPLALLLLACGGEGSDRSVIQNTGSDTLLNVAQAWACLLYTSDAADE